MKFPPRWIKLHFSYASILNFRTIYQFARSARTAAEKFPF